MNNESRISAKRQHRAPAASERGRFLQGRSRPRPVNVGVAVQQSKFDYTLEATDCSDRNSGSSRCGQEFGTGWSAEEKKALIEYLKALLNPLFRQLPALLGAGTVGISHFNRPPRPG